MSLLPRPGETGGQRLLRRRGIGAHLGVRLDHRAYRICGIQGDQLRRTPLQRPREPIETAKIVRHRLEITRRDITHPLTEREPFGQEFPNSDAEVIEILINPAHMIMRTKTPRSLNYPGDAHPVDDTGLSMSLIC